MGDPKSPDDEAEVTAVAGQVAADTDSISVPTDLVDEASAGSVPEKALWATIRTLTFAAKVKLALRGNKNARSILLRDTNKLIRRLVVQNPRISEEEIIALCKDRNTDGEILRMIAESQEWTKIHAVRLGLVENARTPVDKALKLLVTLGEREISRLAKSKDVSSVIVTRARRMLLQTQRR